MLIHTTLIYAGCLGFLLIILSFNVMQNWVRVTSAGKETDRALRRAERLLSSYVEYVPIGLILLSLIELQGPPVVVIHLLGSALVIARVLHAYGSNEVVGSGIMRFIGAQLTFVMLTVASMSCIFYYALGHI